jgi:hypothetical protein
MKKIDLGQAIQILANVGVIASIVFLALQLQQNNELLEGQARAEQLEARTAPARLFLNNVDIPSIGYKVSVGQSLSPEEDYVYRQFVIFSFIQWEWQYGEYRAGTLKRESIPTQGWRIAAAGRPIWRDVWNTFGSDSARTPGFVKFVNENVFDQ